jgi:hypothetical protein
MQAGLLATLPVPSTPIERAWHVVHMSERRLPQVANAFREFLMQSGAAVAGLTAPPEMHKARSGRKKMEVGDATGVRRKV